MSSQDCTLSKVAIALTIYLAPISPCHSFFLLGYTSPDSSSISGLVVVEGQSDNGGVKVLCENKGPGFSTLFYASITIGDGVYQMDSFITNNFNKSVVLSKVEVYNDQNQLSAQSSDPSILNNNSLDSSTTVGISIRPFFAPSVSAASKWTTKWYCSYKGNAFTVVGIFSQNYPSPFGSHLTVERMSDSQEEPAIRKIQTQSTLIPAEARPPREQLSSMDSLFTDGSGFYRSYLTNAIYRFTFSKKGYVVQGTTDQLIYFNQSLDTVHLKKVTIPVVPVLASPADGATNQSSTLILNWMVSTGATSYRLQVSTNSLFQSSVFDDSTITANAKQVGPLQNNMTYYWRVSARNDGGTSACSQVRSFTTIVAAPSAPILAAPLSGAVNQPTTLILRWSRSIGAQTYCLQIATDSLFAGIVFGDSTLTDTLRQVGPLQNSRKYYWRVTAKNTGGLSPFSTAWNFTTIPALFSVSGTVRYGNSTNTPISGATVVLTPVPSGTTRLITTDASGAYSFALVSPGTYSLTVTKVGGHPSGYVNAADALKAALYSVSPTTYPLTSIQEFAADVNNDGVVNSADALQMMLHYVGSITSFGKGDWVFLPSAPSFNVATQDVTNDITGLAVGDVNSDAQPGSAYFANANGTAYVVAEAAPAMKVSMNDAFEVPVRVKAAASLGSMSLAFQYPVQSATFISVRGPEGMVGAANNAVVAVAWISTEHALDLKENDVLLTLRFKPTSNIKDFGVTLDPNSQVTDAQGTVLGRINLEIPSAEASIPTVFALGQNYPNPFNPSTTIPYDLPAADHVTLVVYNMLGQVVAKLVDEEQKVGTYNVRWDGSGATSGLYFYRLQAGAFAETKKLVLLK